MPTPPCNFLQAAINDFYSINSERRKKKTHAVVAGNISARINGRAMKQQQDF